MRRRRPGALPLKCTCLRSIHTLSSDGGGDGDGGGGDGGDGDGGGDDDRGDGGSRVNGRLGVRWWHRLPRSKFPSKEERCRLLTRYEGPKNVFLFPPLTSEKWMQLG